tara:strand:+ start:2032 stop:2349 length:318 start_codon:yes stop_codon:yes gene_type:complete
MGERIVPEVVEEAGRKEDADIIVGQVEARVGSQELLYELPREMIDAERVFEPRVTGTRIDEENVAKLGDVAEALEVFRVDQLDQIVWYVNVTPDGIPNGLTRVEE